MRKKEDLGLERIFPERLEDALELRGLEPEDLEADDVSAASTIKYYGRYGGRLPSLRTAVRIACHLGVSLDWLCGLSDDMDGDIWNETDVLF